MKRSLPWIAAALLAVAALGAGQIAVQVRSAKLRSKPEFLGPVVATLAYGDKVEQTAEQAGWIKVRTAAGKEGWLHETSVAGARKVAAGEKKARTHASQSEVALAGKGFNEQVEAQYASEHKDLNFSLVDRMEKTQASEAELREFAMAGGLLQGGGGQ